MVGGLQHHRFEHGSHGNTPYDNIIVWYWVYPLFRLKTLYPEPGGSPASCTILCHLSQNTTTSHPNIFVKQRLQSNKLTCWRLLEGYCEIAFTCGKIYPVCDVTLQQIVTNFFLQGHKSPRPPAKLYARSQPFDFHNKHCNLSIQGVCLLSVPPPGMLLGQKLSDG